MGTTNTLDLNNRVNALEKAVSGGDSAQANKSDIATEFSATTNYTAGCFVYYGGKLYQFNADHTAGAWDPTDAVEANVTDQVVSNAAAIAGLTASDVAYDNTDSGLTATDVQGAVDELRQADNIMMSDGVTSVEDALDDTAKKAETATNITMTPSSGITIESSRIMKMDKLVIAQLELKWSTPTMNEYNAITFNGFDVGGNYAVGVVANNNSSTKGTFILSSSNLYIKLSSSDVTSNTILCMTVIGFTM